MVAAAVCFWCGGGGGWCWKVVVASVAGCFWCGCGVYMVGCGGGVCRRPYCFFDVLVEVVVVVTAVELNVAMN